MHSAGLELAKLTFARLEDNLIRHQGDRYILDAHVGQTNFPIPLLIRTSSYERVDDNNDNSEFR